MALYFFDNSIGMLFICFLCDTYRVYVARAAAIPLEILLGALLIERLLERKEKAEKFNQLMYIKESPVSF
ncbi:hypothetical protein [Candidatus Kuenenia stuttgartiensis]|uniref:hypothetical protein n=1 Tax=Kuenenia stuttgartiensis TaxID=174633 RepID=UPI00146A4409|nr:hypothetical protein [Candidatus Kuenenia stuttgartiensis]